MTLFTIGFTKSTAESFFGRLRAARVRKVVDVRLNHVSQLAGFAKTPDLAYFLRELSGIGYEARTELAPTQAIIEAYRKHKGPWADLERDFLKLIAERRIEASLSPTDLDGACLLCSEDTPHRCHRRLVAEYLNRKWGGIEIVHL